MVGAAVKFEHETTGRLPENGHFTARPGDWTGLLTVLVFTDEKHGVIYQDGVTTLSFAFVDGEGLWRYGAYLTLEDYRPTPETICEPAEDNRFGWAATHKTVHDSREEWVFRMADGRVMKTYMKHNDIEIRRAEKPDGILVNLRFYGDYGGQVGKPDEYYRVQYKLPLEQFMWRKAARIGPDGFFPEAEDFVDIRYVGPAARMARYPVKPCPITITGR